MLSVEQIETFRRDGVLVVDDVFDAAQVEALRDALHEHNRTTHGIDHALLLDGDAETLARLAGPRIKSPISNTFYPRWKLEANCAVWPIVSQLWQATFAIQFEHFRHPFGNFDARRGYLFIDRVCYRLPDSLSAEGGLGVHIDRNVKQPYGPALLKWRPIQGFVALTAQYGGKSGGLRASRGFHRDDAYFDVADVSLESEGGEFHRLPFNRHRRVHELCQPVDCAAGALVLWDNRIPHATCNELVNGGDTREVLYTSFLPAGVPVNDRYAADQAQALAANRPPPAFRDTGADADRDWSVDAPPFDEPTQRLLGLRPW